MLKGLDLSRHNRNMKDLNVLNSYDFIILKASEGATYRDSSVSFYLHYLRKDMLKGFYHFARPENGNSAKSEASNFLATILKYIDGQTILALDVEDGALRASDLDTWCFEFCKYVYDATGIKPLIYCSEAETKRFKKCADFDCGLWVAKWSLTKPSKKNIKPWEIFAIWQKTNKHIVSGVQCDLDVFNGSREQYLKYCVSK